MSKRESKNLGLVIFSRMTSSRLPGKALMEINGRYLLQRVIDRAKEVKNYGPIVVATSISRSDDPIADLVQKCNVDLYRGDLNDVMSRALGVCKKYNLVGLIRICGDRPFFDDKIVSALADKFLKTNFDVVTTVFPRTVPPGLTTEVISTAALERGCENAVNTYDREHLTTFFYNNPREFTILNCDPLVGIKYPDVSLVVDTISDYKRAVWIAKRIDTSNYCLENVILLAKQWSLKKNGEIN
jgi:spore coat polysaccharide biosynthesis protein SpsF